MAPDPYREFWHFTGYNGYKQLLSSNIKHIAITGLYLSVALIATLDRNDGLL
jgi:hypothetical protein